VSTQTTRKRAPKPEAKPESEAKPFLIIDGYVPGSDPLPAEDLLSRVGFTDRSYFTDAAKDPETGLAVQLAVIAEAVAPWFEATQQIETRSAALSRANLAIRRMIRNHVGERDYAANTTAYALTWTAWFESACDAIKDPATGQGTMTVKDREDLRKAVRTWMSRHRLIDAAMAEDLLSEVPEVAAETVQDTAGNVVAIGDAIAKVKSGDSSVDNVTWPVQVREGIAAKYAAQVTVKGKPVRDFKPADVPTTMGKKPRESAVRTPVPPEAKLAEVGASIQPDSEGKPRVAAMHTAKLARRFVTDARDATLGKPSEARPDLAETPEDLVEWWKGIAQEAAAVAAVLAGKMLRETSEKHRYTEDLTK